MRSHNHRRCVYREKTTMVVMFGSTINTILVYMVNMVNAYMVYTITTQPQRNLQGATPPCGTHPQHSHCWRCTSCRCPHPRVQGRQVQGSRCAVVQHHQCLPWPASKPCSGTVLTNNGLLDGKVDGKIAPHPNSPKQNPSRSQTNKHHHTRTPTLQDRHVEQLVHC